MRAICKTQKYWKTGSEKIANRCASVCNGNVASTFANEASCARREYAAMQPIQVDEPALRAELNEDELLDEAGEA